mgnify:CR=1 FL=1
MKKTVAYTGNEAVAFGMKQINPDVVAAYPITPQTEIVQIFSNFVADGLVDTEFVTVESEHSAMSAVIGAAAAGARSMTATSSAGLAYMHEVVYIAASMRLPIVMQVVNRALSGPINIHCDHSDAMGERDSGWIQIYAENAQEAYDNLLQAHRIAEHPDVMLPVMVCMDGFIISHALENIELNDDAFVQDFVGSYQPDHYLLDVENPLTVGPLDMFDYYFEHKRHQAEAMRKAKQVIIDVGKAYGEKTNRSYGLYETYQLADAETAIVVMGSTAGTAKAVVNELRKQGQKVGLLKLRSFRPFPHQELAQELQHLKAIAVLDRADSFNAFGAPLFTQTRAALYDLPDRPQMINYIYGLGGRDCDLSQIGQVYQDLQQVVAQGHGGEIVRYLGVRE